MLRLWYERWFACLLRQVLENAWKCLISGVSNMLTLALLLGRRVDEDVQP